MEFAEEEEGKRKFRHSCDELALMEFLRTVPSSIIVFRAKKTETKRLKIFVCQWDPCLEGILVNLCVQCMGASMKLFSPKHWT